MQDTQRIHVSSIFNAIKDSYPVNLNERIEKWLENRSLDSSYHWIDLQVFLSLMEEIGEPVEMVYGKINLESVDALYLCRFLKRYYANKVSDMCSMAIVCEWHVFEIINLLKNWYHEIVKARVYKSNITNVCNIIQKKLPHLASVVAAYQKYWEDQFKNREMKIDTGEYAYFEDRCIPIKFKVNSPNIDFDQISTLHLCEYLRDFTVGHNISHPLLDQLIEMCQQNEQSVELMKVLISKSNDYGSGLFFEEVVIYKNVFEQMLPQLTKYKKFKSLDSDGHPITEDVYLRKEDTIELPWFFSKMYVKKDSGFVLTDEMLFHYSYMMDVKIIEIVIGYHDSQTIKKEFVISLDDYKELPSELINEQDHVYSGFWDDLD